LPAIDLELQRSNFVGALERVDTLAAQSARKETWLKRRGEILIQAGRPQEAREAFQQALAALRSLPPSRRNVPAMMEMEQALLSRLSSANTTSKPEIK
jgi:predicted negative regulator of RcsB-dependent stress response